MLLKDRTALVTGGAGRLGRAIAAAVVREGGRVILADRDKDRAGAGRRCLEGKDRLSRPATVHGDVVGRGRTSRACSKRAGAFDILVNAHGIFPNRPILEMTVDEWDQVFAINVRGSMLTCRGAARRWTETQRERRDREHLVGRIALGARRRLALHRLEGRGEHDDRGAGDRARPARHPRQCGAARPRSSTTW